MSVQVENKSSVPSIRFFDKFKMIYVLFNKINLSFKDFKLCRDKNLEDFRIIFFNFAQFEKKCYEKFKSH